MGRVVSRFVVVSLVVSSLTIPAYAEDLVMPFACTPSGPGVQVAPANETSYRIAGRRDEQPFVSCATGNATCETMMVHRFTIECDGTRVPWSRVAMAAKGLGIALPAGLPVGFAPVSTMSGRFVLPALTRTAPLVTRVAMQDLSPESVVESPDDAGRGSGPAWVTVIQSDVLNRTAEGRSGRLAASLASVLVMLLAASMVAAGRWRLPGLNYAAPMAAMISALKTWTLNVLDACRGTWQRRFQGIASAAAMESRTYREDLLNARAILETRLVETELLVGSLPRDLLLRDVLMSELRTVRQRLAEIDRQMGAGSPAKSAAIIRNALRDLDRIVRIGQSAIVGRDEYKGSEFDMPQSSAEAYRVLGINSDAAPQVAKKLVDALRMSWHPDHARDEHDRLGREQRMKQINAAWDLIKARRSAA